MVQNVLLLRMKGQVLSLLFMAEDIVSLNKRPLLFPNLIDLGLH